MYPEETIPSKGNPLSVSLTFSPMAFIRRINRSFKS